MSSGAPCSVNGAHAAVGGAPGGLGAYVAIVRQELARAGGIVAVGGWETEGLDVAGGKADGEERERWVESLDDEVGRQWERANVLEHRAGGMLRAGGAEAGGGDARVTKENCKWASGGSVAESVALWQRGGVNGDDAVCGGPK